MFFDILEEYPANIYTEVPLGNLLLIRSNDITFDEKGIKILTHIYKVASMLQLKDAKVGISVFTDHMCFKASDGSTYNEEVVSLEEFLRDIEY